jgi:hypothetical protein
MTVCETHSVSSHGAKLQMAAHSLAIASDHVELQCNAKKKRLFDNVFVSGTMRFFLIQPGGNDPRRSYKHLLFVFISGTMRFSRYGLGASSPLIITPQYQR